MLVDCRGSRRISLISRSTQSLPWKANAPLSAPGHTALLSWRPWHCSACPLKCQTKVTLNAQYLYCTGMNWENVSEPEAEYVAWQTAQPILARGRLRQRELGTSTWACLGIHRLLRVSHQVWVVPPCTRTIWLMGSCARGVRQWFRSPQHLHNTSHNFMLGKLMLCEVMHLGELNPPEITAPPLLNTITDHYHHPLSQPPTSDDALGKCCASPWGICAFLLYGIHTSRSHFPTPHCQGLHKDKRKACPLPCKQVSDQRKTAAQKHIGVRFFFQTFICTHSHAQSPISSWNWTGSHLRALFYHGSDTQNCRLAPAMFLLRL